MKFREACVEAVKQSKEHGVVFYVHEAPTMWDITPAYKSGWLFKVYPGGRKIFATAADKFLQAETRPTCAAPDAAYCTCKHPTFSSIFSSICRECGKVAAPVS